MEEQLIDIDIDTNDISSNYIQNVWEIENAEKMQFVSFIEDKIEEKYLKKFDYYEKSLLSLQKELNDCKHALQETTEYVHYLQNENNNKMIYIPVDINANYLPNFSCGFLVYNKHDRKGCINRDKNGCKNIQKVFNYYLETGERPEKYSRKYKI